MANTINLNDDVLDQLKPIYRANFPKKRFKKEDVVNMALEIALDFSKHGEDFEAITGLKLLK